MLKVLIADDDYCICSCLRNVIEWADLGYELIGEAHNGLEILSFAKENHIDVLITDVKMPYMDGLEACKYFQTHSKKTDIILLSAYEEFDIVREAINYNVCKYVLKPLTTEKLASVSKILAGIFELHEHEQYASYLLIDSGFKEQMWENLKKENLNYFQDIFTELNTEYSDEIMVVKAIYFRMIGILYEYLVHIGFPKKQIEKYRHSNTEQLEMLNSVSEMTTLIKQLFEDILQFSPESAESHIAHIVEQIKAYIYDNYKDVMLSRTSIAEHISLHPGYVSRIFGEYMNMGIAQYIMNVRMEFAVELLRTTTESVGTIAEQVGFSNSRYFSKNFKQIYGMTPGEYRKRYHYVENKEE